MKYSKRSEKQILDLLILPLQEYIEKWDDEASESGLYSLKSYYNKKLKETDVEKEPTTNVDRVAELLKEFGIESMPESAEVGFHVGFIKNAEGEIEYTKPMPSVRSKRSGQQLSDFISQADPLRIVPNKVKPPKRDYKLLYVFGDPQIDYRNYDGEEHPIHDESVLEVHRQIVAHYQPETLVNLGDTVDLAALSRFGADSDHFRHSLNPAFNRVHRMYADFRASSPTTEIHEVDSNHNLRLSKFILKNAIELYGIKQAGTSVENYPILTYPFFANLDAVGVKWHGGYGAAEFVYGEEYGAPPIVFKHGQITASGASTMVKEARENPYTHVVRGHGHSAETIYKTNRLGQYLAYIMVAASCRLDGVVPSYHSAVDDRGHPVKTQEKWQQGGLLIEDYQDGTYNFRHILIKDGKTIIDGVEFSA